MLTQYVCPNCAKTLCIRDDKYIDRNKKFYCVSCKKDIPYESTIKDVEKHQTCTEINLDIPYLTGIEVLKIEEIKLRKECAELAYIQSELEIKIEAIHREIERTNK